jgi:7-carboxy-7-deazaguanine synthase
VAEVLQTVLDHQLEHVVLTGGEPMLFAELIPLTQQLHRLGKHITIETAGTLFLPVTCDLMSISPKLGNSDPTVDQAGKWRQRHQRDRQRTDVVLQLLSQYACQLKFVVDCPADLAEIDQYLAKFPFVLPQQIWLMPQGVTAEELAAKEDWLAGICQDRGWELCARKHIEWYGYQRGV